MERTAQPKQDRDSPPANKINSPSFGGTANLRLFATRPKIIRNIPTSNHGLAVQCLELETDKTENSK